MNSKKLFNGGNSGKTERNHVKKIGGRDNNVKENGSNFSQTGYKHVNKARVSAGIGFMKPVNPRQLSFFIISQYFSEKSNLKFLLNNSFDKYPLSELDRRFVYEVVKGTVRYVLRIDFLISLFSNKTIKSLDKDVLNILRQAVYQLLYMDKTPAYAAINESVEIAKRQIGAYSSKFVNGVLRKINTVPKIQEFLDNSIKNTCTKPSERLSVMYSYPLWLANYWIKSYGIERTELLFNLLNHEPTVFIRVNRLKTDKIKLINTFKESGMLQYRDFFPEPFDNIEDLADREITSGAAGDISPDDSSKITTGANRNIGTVESSKINAAIAGNISPGDNTGMIAGTAGSINSFNKPGLFDGCIILKSVQNIEKIPGYLQGHFSVQDFSSQFAVKYFLCPAGHDRILDVCSAPGGKATYMAELTDDKAEIVSVDINKKKNDLFKENIARLGINNITIVNADVTKDGFLGQESFENYFDKIFIDAPCSALGTISKNPDAKYANTLPDMERLGEISGKILSAADKYLKPGGIIILYKCTLSEIENQGPVKRFILQNPAKYRISHPFSNYKNIHDSSDDGKGSFFEIMPDYFSSEAGFICTLKKSE